MERKNNDIRTVEDNPRMPNRNYEKPIVGCATDVRVDYNDHVRSVRDKENIMIMNHTPRMPNRNYEKPIVGEWTNLPLDYNPRIGGKH
ncbi:MAG: hypothetical protein Q7S06_02735 [Nanoarchaeota archaeon]|nr:hypothetical protein [Nanoarchaeota archaeon]